MHHLQKHINQDIKRDKAKIRTQQYTYITEYRSKRNPTGKPPVGLTRAKASGPTILSIDVFKLHQHAIKEESKVANRDWVDHQACSLLQYINHIANLPTTGKHPNEPRRKTTRVNGLLPLIHQVTIEFRLCKSLAQERPSPTRNPDIKP